MGRPGRLALSQVLPLWKTEYQPDVVIGNVENLTHGKGIIARHIEDLNAIGFDVYTSGNHVFDSGPRAEECFEKFHNIVRPANYLTLDDSFSSPPFHPLLFKEGWPEARVVMCQDKVSTVSPKIINSI